MWRVKFVLGHSSEYWRKNTRVEANVLQGPVHVGVQRFLVSTQVHAKVIHVPQSVPDLF